MDEDAEKEPGSVVDSVPEVAENEAGRLSLFQHRTRTDEDTNFTEFRRRLMLNPRHIRKEIPEHLDIHKETTTDSQAITASCSSRPTADPQPVITSQPIVASQPINAFHPIALKNNKGNNSNSADSDDEFVSNPKRQKVVESSESDDSSLYSQTGVNKVPFEQI